MKLIENWRALWRAWSIQVAAAGAALYALLLADPAGLQAAWNALPEDVRAILPDQAAKWITLALFVLVALARVAKQPGGTAPALGLMSATPRKTWREAARAPNPRPITSIAIHCSATREGRPFFAADIRRWHKAKGWSDIGYHFVVGLDGAIEAGRPLKSIGAHVAGHNANSIGICYIGGVAADGKTPKDTRTPAQKTALLELLGELRGRYPAAVIKGHRDYPGVAKACPSFDARAEYAAEYTGARP